MSCHHDNFFAKVDVQRLLKNESDADASAFVAEIKINCSDCGLRFEFLGVPMGYQPGATRCSPDGLELRAALKPKGVTLDQAGMVGFNIKVQQP